MYQDTTIVCHEAFTSDARTIVPDGEVLGILDNLRVLGGYEGQALVAERIVDGQALCSVYVLGEGYELHLGSLVAVPAGKTVIVQNIYLTLVDFEVSVHYVIIAVYEIQVVGLSPCQTGQPILWLENPRAP